MNQKDLIKYGLLALGAYLVWKYLQDHGGIDGLFGTAVPHPSTGTTTGTMTGATPPAVTGTVPPGQTIAPTVLDMTGLVVVPDINDALSGTVRINGVPTRLSIITGDGRIFNTSGQEVTAPLQAQGVDIIALRSAFANAGGLAGMGAMQYSLPAWMVN